MGKRCGGGGGDIITTVRPDNIIILWETKEAIYNII